MAGMTTSSSSALRAASLLTPTRTTSSLSSSSDSIFLSSRLCLPDFSKFDLSSSSSSRISAITAMRGRSRQREPDSDSDDEDEKSLDMSTIRSTTVRLIDQEQKMVGVVSMREAQQMADDAKLDLVIISPDADPPVVKIMDYDKFRYEGRRKKRDQQKKSVSRTGVKEVKMGYNIDTHDYAVRLKAARKFLSEGHKVKMIVQLKGRQNIFKNNAIELIKRFQSDIGELATEESKNFKDRNMFMILVPNKAFIQKATNRAKKQDDPEDVTEDDPEDDIEDVTEDDTEDDTESKPDETEAEPDETEVNQLPVGV